MPRYRTRPRYDEPTIVLPWGGDEADVLVERLRRAGGIARSADQDLLAQIIRDAFRVRDAASGWQPIETAPRDGTWVLGLGDSGVSSPRWRYHLMRWVGGRWRTEQNDDFTDDGPEPLYWRPDLPPSTPEKRPRQPLSSSD
jgi:hypothetical protein